MTKITFAEIMEELMNCRRKQEEWINRGEGIVDANYLYEIYSTDAIRIAAKMIEESVCGFSDGWIEYFLYDCDYDFNGFKAEYENEDGEWIGVEPKDLNEFYDFLEGRKI